MRVYCDHAATTPLCDAAWQAMEPFLRERFGNPSEPHAEGRAARAGLDAARAEVAEALGTRELDVVFTGGGSEADNLARARPPRAAAGASSRRRSSTRPSPERSRRPPTRSPSRPSMRRASSISLALAELIRPGDRLCAVIWASNLTGVIQPVREIAELCAERGVPLAPRCRAGRGLAAPATRRAAR